jgi:hypothetical protein
VTLAARLSSGEIPQEIFGPANGVGTRQLRNRAATVHKLAFNSDGASVTFAPASARCGSPVATEQRDRTPA